MSAKERELALSKALDVKVILSAMALNAGFNLPSLDGAICLSGTSSSLTFIQQIGRLLRKTEEDKVGIYINLYAASTVEEDWLKSKLDIRQSTKVSESEIIKYVTS
jgi:superfamily II DNA or RNA helicase